MKEQICKQCKDKFKELVSKYINNDKWYEEGSSPYFVLYKLKEEIETFK